ncbi:hypothetical protein ACOTCG_08535 [Achromobacter xylosoxidans]
MKRLVSVILLSAFAIAQAQETRTWHFTGAELAAALVGRMPSEVRDASLGRHFSASCLPADSGSPRRSPAVESIGRARCSTVVTDAPVHPTPRSSNRCRV